MCVVSIFPFTRVNQIAIFIIVRAFSALLSFFELSLIHNLSIIVIPSTLSTFLAIVHFTAVPEVINSQWLRTKARRQQPAGFQ